MTVPELSFETVGHGNIGKRRKEFNEMVVGKIIQDYEVKEVKDTGGGDEDGDGDVGVGKDGVIQGAAIRPEANYSKVDYAVVDIASEIPMLSLSQEERKLWYCDGLHLTKKGYNKVANIVYSEISNQGWTK